MGSLLTIYLYFKFLQDRDIFIFSLHLMLTEFKMFSLNWTINKGDLIFVFSLK